MMAKFHKDTFKVQERIILDMKNKEERIGRINWKNRLEEKIGTLMYYLPTSTYRGLSVPALYVHLYI